MCNEKGLSRYDRWFENTNKKYGINEGNSMLINDVLGSLL